LIELSLATLERGLHVKTRARTLERGLHVKTRARTLERLLVEFVWAT